MAIPRRIRIENDYATYTADELKPKGINAVHESAYVPLVDLGSCLIVSRALWLATVAAFWPWRHREYRGWSHHAGLAVGVEPQTVLRWAGAGGRGVSHAASLRITALLRRRIEILTELLTGWERYAAARRQIEAGDAGFKFTGWGAAERETWAPSTPRVRRKGRIPPTP